MIKGRPPRREQIFQTYDPPLYFVTVCTIHREKITDLRTVHHALESYARRGQDDFGVAVGRYVIMPDHLHFFVRGCNDFKLAQWVNGLKRAISVRLGVTKKRPFWQPGFFDHILRRELTIGPIKANLCSLIGNNFAADTAAPTQESSPPKDLFRAQLV